MKSICSHLAACWPCAPMKRGLLNQRKPASIPSIAREARQGQSDVEQENRRVEERCVDAEADDRDEAEEAVEQDQDESDDEQADERRLLRLIQRVLAERGGDVRPLRGRECDGQRTGL